MLSKLLCVTLKFSDDFVVCTWLLILDTRKKSHYLLTPPRPPSFQYTNSIA